MSQYGQFCPVALALEIIGERWTLLVVRELLCGSKRFSDIQRGVPLCSRSVLAQRLRTLTEAGVIAKVAGGYELTKAGEELRPIVLSCGEWGKRWAFRDLANEDVDITLLMWDMRRRVDLDALPRDEAWLEFEFRPAPKNHRRFWLHLQRGHETDLCITHPGFEMDLHVRTSPAVLGSVWSGERRIKDAISNGEVALQGDRRLARAFPRLLELSIFAQTRRVS